VNLYAESSAVLAWLLGETEQNTILRQLSNAEIVMTSDLTLVECDRVLARCLAVRSITEAEIADRQALLNKAAANWNVMRLDQAVIQRARRSFPVEPIRTLDALHLASALTARSALPGLALLSLDQRVRDNGRRLGFTLLPE
jgi:uncharacterized protein with PIN domain